MLPLGNGSRPHPGQPASSGAKTGHIHAKTWRDITGAQGGQISDMVHKADAGGRGGGLWIPLLIFVILSYRIVAQMPGPADFFVSLENDSAVRLVVIRELMAGQGWFDMSLPRLGPGTDFQIHWSRLVDGPIAGLIWISGFFTDRADAEYLALTIWPLALFAAIILLPAAIAARLGGGVAGLVAGLVSALTFNSNRLFKPGAMDHHNLQMVLLAVVILGLVGRKRPGLAALGGFAMAYSLAIGVETLPHLAVAAVAMALIWFAGGPAERPGALGFAAGLGAGLPVLFLVSAPAAAYRGGFCDALSVDLAVPVTLGAAALGLAASLVSTRSAAMRLAVLGVAGAVIALVTLRYLPACLTNPYAALDPYLRDRWLALVNEAQSLPFILRHQIVTPLYLGFYLLAGAAMLISLGFARARPAQRAEWLSFAALLAVSLVMSWYQVRGTVAANLVSIVPMAAAIAGLRLRMAERRAPRYGFLALGLLIACLPITWWSAANLIGRTQHPGGTMPAGVTAAAPVSRGGCFTPDGFAALAALPPGLISANSNLGAQLLLNTPHRVLAAPYHRNQAGMRAQLEISLAGSGAEAEAVMRRVGVTYVVSCDDDPELATLATLGFSGFGLKLQHGEVPDFLVPVPLDADTALRVYRLR